MNGDLLDDHLVFGHECTRKWFHSAILSLRLEVLVGFDPAFDLVRSRAALALLFGLS